MTSVREVVENFDSFLKTYKEFKKDHGLKLTLSNPFEITTALSDKIGRICREVKHKERNDPRPHYQSTISEETFGLIVYALMICDFYDSNVIFGMVKELQKAVDQHGS